MASSVNKEYNKTVVTQEKRERVEERGEVQEPLIPIGAIGEESEQTHASEIDE